MILTIVRDGKELDLIITNGTDPGKEGYIQEQVRITQPIIRLKVDEATLEIEEIEYS